MCLIRIEYIIAIIAVITRAIAISLYPFILFPILPAAAIIVGYDVILFTFVFPAPDELVESLGDLSGNGLFGRLFSRLLCRLFRRGCCR